MKVQFDHQQLQNFDFGVNKEWIEVNNRGAFACSTLYGLNNQCYHGLLAVAVGPPNERIILLSKFEESVFIDHHVHEISANQYAGGVYPEGYKYLHRVSMDPFPRFTYMINQQRLEKTIFLVHDQNTLVLRYANKNQGPPLQMILKPIFAYRKTTELSQQLPYINTDSYLEENMVRFAPKSEMPALNIYYFKGKYTPAPLWYYNYRYLPGYIENLPAGKQPIEDLLNPGFFSCTLEAYETLDLFISVDRLTNIDYEELFRREKDYRRNVPSIFLNGSAFAADLAEKLRTGVVSSKDQPDLILPCYHHYQIFTREMLFSLPGLTLLLDDRDKIKYTIERCLNSLRDGLLPFKYPFVETLVDDRCADCSLLFINFLYFFYHLLKDKSYLQEVLLNPCLSIIEAYRSGTRHNIYCDKDNLVFSGDQETAVSWIPLRNQEGKVVRYGKLLEINALWYNALKIIEYFCRELKKRRSMKKFNRLALNCRTSFLIYFWDETNKRFYDLVRENYSDPSFRINQLFLLALPFPILEMKSGHSVLQQIEAELLTPYGLRSLSPRGEEYTGKLEFMTDKKNPPYYRGAVWPWTVGLYVDAVLRFRGKDAETVNSLLQYVDGFSELFYNRGLGYISEICEGEEPYRANGSLVYNLNLVELLRSIYTLESVKVKKTHKGK
jgi:predicted glycogen debranching enzyme